MPTLSGALWALVSLLPVATRSVAPSAPATSLPPALPGLATPPCERAPPSVRRLALRPDDVCEDDLGRVVRRWGTPARQDYQPLVAQARAFAAWMRGEGEQGAAWSGSSGGWDGEWLTAAEIDGLYEHWTAEAGVQRHAADHLRGALALLPGVATARRRLQSDDMAALRRRAGRERTELYRIATEGEMQAEAEAEAEAKAAASTSNGKAASKARPVVARARLREAA